MGAMSAAVSCLEGSGDGSWEGRWVAAVVATRGGVAVMTAAKLCSKPASAIPDHHQQTTARVLVVFVYLQVFGQLGDTGGQ